MACGMLVVLSSHLHGFMLALRRARPLHTHFIGPNKETCELLSTVDIILGHVLRVHEGSVELDLRTCSPVSDCEAVSPDLSVLAVGGQKPL